MADSELYSKDPQTRDRARRISRYNSPDRRVRNSVTMFMDEDNDTLIRGDHSELVELDEAKETIRWLFNATRPKLDRAGAKPGIQLIAYKIRVFAVYTGVQPHGIDFMCTDIDKLIKDMKSFSQDPKVLDPNNIYNIPAQPVFNIDSESGLMGRFAGLVTPGTGFREISTGASLHVELMGKGQCNIHIDKAGIVCGFRKYNLLNFINHGLTDLLVGYTNSPALYGSIGGVSWKPDLQLKLTTDPFAFGGGAKDFHDQTALQERELGWSITLGYKLEWK